MAIKIIFGPGGSGKSFFQMHVIIKQLRETRRNICTNLAINIPEFHAYLEDKYGESFDLLRRLRILTESETFEFWNYRGPLKWTGNEYEMEEDRGVFGVCYIIDEAGVSGFSATGWAAKVGQSTRGERCLWYLDQQRKFGDDVFASTNGRTPAQIAKPFRDKAHGFIKLWNGYLAKYGIFRGRGRFEWREFLEEPGPKSEPISSGKFELGDLANCYRTQDGVGVIGNAADKGARAKGIPILWVIPAALVLALMCVFVPYLLGKGASSYIGGKKPAEHASDGPATTTVSSPGVSTVSDAQARKEGIPAPLEPVYADTRPEHPLTVTGYVYTLSRVNVQLSDGRVLTEKDPELMKVERNAVHLKDGKRLFIAGYRPPVAVQQESQAAPAAVAEPVAVETPSYPPPPPDRTESSWQMHSDGVLRLKPDASAASRAFGPKTSGK